MQCLPKTRNHPTRRAANAAGYQARLKGLPKTANGYIPETEWHGNAWEWEQGWEAAKAAGH